LSPGSSPRALIRTATLTSRDFASLDALVVEFLGAERGRVTHASIGIAGPVVDGRCDTTNLPWSMDARSLGEAMGGAEVTLLNDLEATGWGLAHLDDAELRPLQAGRPAPGNRALVAAGTGLGEAILVWDGTRHRPSASEGGHTDFGPRDTVEDELLEWLRARHGHVSYERILSGPGLADLYRFMADTGRGRANAEVAERFAAAADPAAIVSDAALHGGCERAALALDRFVRVYGAEAGNLALKALAVNGLFIGGGIGPRIASALVGGAFVEAFLDKGRLAPVLERVPVQLILDDRAALWGAAAHALTDVSNAPVQRAVRAPGGTTR
jgi:glucokinase